MERKNVRALVDEGHHTGTDQEFMAFAMAYVCYEYGPDVPPEFNELLAKTGDRKLVLDAMLSQGLNSLI